MGDIVAKIILTYLVLSWLLLSILDYGLSFAYYQRKYPRIAESWYWYDRIICMILAPGCVGGLSGFGGVLGVRSNTG